MRELVRILEREAALIEQVLFRLKSVQLLLAADEHRFMTQGSEELDEVAEELGALDAMRAVIVAEIARDFGLAEDANLRELAAAANAEDRAVIEGLRRRLLDLTSQLEAEAASSRALTLARVAEVRKVVERLLGNRGARYGIDGIPDPPSAPLGGDHIDRRL